MTSKQTARGSGSRASTSLSVADELETTRSHALLAVSIEQVLRADPSALVAVQAVLQHGNSLGRWQTPRRWLPTVTPVKRDVDIRARIIASIRDSDLREKATQRQAAPLLDEAVVALTRYLVVLRMGPAAMVGKGDGASLDPRTLAEIAYFVAPPLFAAALTKQLEQGGRRDIGDGFLSVVKHKDLDSIAPSIRELILAEARRMAYLQERGCWHDVPDLGHELSPVTEVAGDAASATTERRLDPHLPLPDDYVSEMGQRSTWFIESLAPNLLLLVKELKRIWDETSVGPSASSIQHQRRHRVGKLLSTWEWRDAEGARITRPPFAINLSQHGKRGKSVSSAPDWPPKTLAAVLGLLSNIQHAHLFVVCLSMGARRSEVLTLQRTCLKVANDGLPYTTGRTFKLVQSHEGELREWVMPDLAVTAIQQQAELVKLVEVFGPQKPFQRTRAEKVKEGDPLWVQLSTVGNHDRNAPLISLDKALRSYARALGMNERPSGQWLRPHRFRKTVARLAALALTQAPKVLMDVFGHKSMEMTLYYILTDKTLQAEIEQVGRELRVMRASTAVEAIVAAEDSGESGLKLGGYGGPAALMVQRAVHVHRERVHQRGEQWGADSVRELAEVLTLQGKAWEVVREGVVCTKFPGSEAGPCNKSRGRPEPSRCQSTCSHRLEEAFLRDDVEAALASSLSEYEAAIAANDELMQAMWVGQIRAHLPRFEDVRARWSKHPLVQRALGSSDDQQEAA